MEHLEQLSLFIPPNGNSRWDVLWGWNARIQAHSHSGMTPAGGEMQRLAVHPENRGDEIMLYAMPGQADAKVQFKSRYDNFIGGKWVAPVKGQYFDVVTPVSGQKYTQAARSTAEDIELALDAAHAAFPTWGKTDATTRSNILLKIADRLEANLELLAYAETVDNGKPIRETLNADIPLAVDHFRYFAGCLRSQEGGISEIDENTMAYHIHEPLGVVGQIIPWNFPILMAAWKLAPALGAGNCVVLKPAESTPISILVLMELIADLLPPGVLNIVNGYGREAGMPLATSKRIAKIAFTGSTSTGRVIAQAAANNLIPATLELGGKSPNIFFADVMDKDDAFLDKAIEGLVLFAFNQGEVCTCPSRALIQESIYDRFMERALKRVAAIKQGSPLDTDTMMGAQASQEQMTKIQSYLALGREEGAEVLIGGNRAQLGGDLTDGFYIQPTLFKGHNKMRIFQEEIFGPVLAVTTFKDEAEALSIANDTLYGLGAGVWSRNGNVAYRMGRAIQAGRVWTNCYHAYPAHAAFGGYKESGIGRETHKVMLDHYQQTKNLLVSYSENKLGFF
jgi:aldehyde dehydrogenase